MSWRKIVLVVVVPFTLAVIFASRLPRRLPPVGPVEERDVPPEVRTWLSGLHWTYRGSYANDCYGTDLAFVRFLPFVDRGVRARSPSSYVFGFCVDETGHWSEKGSNAQSDRRYTTHPNLLPLYDPGIAPSAALVALGDPCERLRKPSRFEVECMSFFAFAVRDADGDGTLEVWTVRATQEVWPPFEWSFEQAD